VSRVPPVLDAQDESGHWLRQFLLLFLVAGAVEWLQAASGLLLWRVAGSSVLLAFGLDSLVGGARELVMACRLRTWSRTGADPGRMGPWIQFAGIGYVLAGVTAFLAGGWTLWQGTHPQATLLGAALASISVLLIPIVGSYMKAVAVELRSPALRAASVFTFGNSYLSMVLLISMLVRIGMGRWWGDPLGSIVMAPFIIQKGIQMLIEERSGDVAERDEAEA